MKRSSALFSQALADRGVRSIAVYIAWFGIEPSDSESVAAVFLDPDEARQALQEAMEALPFCRAAEPLVWQRHDGTWETTCAGLHLHIIERKLHCGAR